MLWILTVGMAGAYYALYLANLLVLVFYTALVFFGFLIVYLASLLNLLLPNSLLDYFETLINYFGDLLFCLYFCLYTSLFMIGTTLSLFLCQQWDLGWYLIQKGHLGWYILFIRSFLENILQDFKT